MPTTIHATHLPQLHTTRVADGSLPLEEAKARNRDQYKRFYGKPMPKEMFF
jgi:hypothetical protein